MKMVQWNATEQSIDGTKVEHCGTDLWNVITERYATGTEHKRNTMEQTYVMLSLNVMYYYRT